MSNSSETNSIIGKELAGRFQLVEKIGQGGMGAVYKAVHTRMGRTCAIKLLLPVSADANLSVERFKREAQLASRIDNPHAVTIYDFGEAEGGALYLAMEFIDGRHLGRIMSDERPLASERIVHITSQIAEALNAAHGLGIVHRDLKPENIMIARKGDNTDYVKVLDFGIAKTFDEGGDDTLTKTGFILGTPFYMSPEQLSGEKLDARSDVYSLALIVYEMFSGRLPFEGDNSQAIMMKRLVSEPKPLRQLVPSISPDVESVIMQALTRDRNERTASVLTFAEELQRAIASTQVLNSRRTNQVVEADSGRPTILIPGSDTNPETLISIPPQNPTQMPNWSQPVNQSYEPTVGIEQVNPSLPPASPLATKTSGPLPGDNRSESVSQSPSAYITKSSPESANPSLPAQELGDAPSTWPMGSEKSNPPAGYYQPVPQSPHQATPLNQPPGFNPYLHQPAQPNPQAMPYPSTPSRPPEPIYPHSPSEIGKKSPLGLILGAGAVILLLGIGAGIYFFTPIFNPSTPISTEPSKRDTSALNPTATKSDDEAAVAHYESGKKHQEQARLLANSGSQTEAAEENKKAIEDYSKAVALKQIYPEAHENLGVASYSIGNLGLAVGELKIAIDQYQQKQQRPTAQVMTNYGLALFDSKRYAEAAEAFHQAYSIDSTDADMLAFQGFALQNAGKLEPAKDAYRNYLKTTPAGQYARAVADILAGREQPPETSGN